MNAQAWPKHEVENVSGADLKPGDLIWNAGYLWRVLDTKLEKFGAINRWYVTCEWSGQGTDPDFFNKSIGFARREDMTWPRQVAA